MHWKNNLLFQAVCEQNADGNKKFILPSYCRIGWGIKSFRIFVKLAHLRKITEPTRKITLRKRSIMAQKTKFREIPVFEKEDSSGINRLFAFLSYFFPIGTLIMWIIFRKKSKYVRMHTKNAFIAAMISLITPLVISLIGMVAFLVEGGGGEALPADEIQQVIKIVCGGFTGLIEFVMFIMILKFLIRSLCGKLESKRNVRRIVEEQLAIGNPEAVEIIKNDDRFADLLAKYNANQARMQQAANNSGNTNTPNGDAK